MAENKGFSLKTFGMRRAKTNQYMEVLYLWLKTKDLV